MVGRVLILVENNPVPTDRRVWQEANALAEAGLEVVVVCPQGEIRDRESFERRNGIEIHRYPALFATGGFTSYIREFWNGLTHMRRMARRLAGDKPFDVVHACNPPDLILPVLRFLKRDGARFVFDHHDLVPELYLSRFGRGKDPAYWIARLLERLTFRHADLVIATNGSYERVALTRGRKRPEDVFVVRNGPDLAQFRPGEADPSLKRGRTHLIAYVGVMGPQDGVDHALNALAALKRRRSDWRAVLAGYGDSLPELRRLATELELGEDVEFVGALDTDEIVRLLSTTDICLAPEPKTPYNDASTMIKITEYMALARPVVCYDLTESRVTAGEAALYAKPSDPLAFALCIEKLLADPAQREAMGALGRRRIESGLSWDHSRRILLAAYKRALVARRTATGTSALRS